MERDSLTENENSYHSNLQPLQRIMINNSSTNCRFSESNNTWQNKWVPLVTEHKRNQLPWQQHTLLYFIMLSKHVKYAYAAYLCLLVNKIIIILTFHTISIHAWFMATTIWTKVLVGTYKNNQMIWWEMVDETKWRTDWYKHKSRATGSI